MRAWHRFFPIPSREYFVLSLSRSATSLHSELLPLRSHFVQQGLGHSFLKVIIRFNNDDFLAHRMLDSSPLEKASHTVMFPSCSDTSVIHSVELRSRPTCDSNIKWALVSCAINKSKYKPENRKKIENQNSPTKRALSKALNFTDWFFSQGPYGHDGTDCSSTCFIFFRSVETSTFWIISSMSVCRISNYCNSRLENVSREFKSGFCWYYAVYIIIVGECRPFCTWDLGVDV